MLHAKFQDHGTNGSGVENFKMFLIHIGMTVILVM